MGFAATLYGCLQLLLVFFMIEGAVREMASPGWRDGVEKRRVMISVATMANGLILSLIVTGDVVMSGEYSETPWRWTVAVLAFAVWAGLGWRNWRNKPASPSSPSPETH